jgi:hypothetical protein
MRQPRSRSFFFLLFPSFSLSQALAVRMLRYCLIAVRLILGVLEALSSSEMMGQLENFMTRTRIRRGLLSFLCPAG